MIKILIIAYIVSFYLALPGFFSKAGYNALLGLIPFYNIFLLMQILEINPILLLLLAIGLIFLPFRVFIVTLIVVFLPFMIGDAYSRSFIYSLIILIIPFIMFPLTAYLLGTYRYNMEV